MHFQPSEVYHIYNRGNNQQPIFFSEKNYLFFLDKVQKQISPVASILCWCLMPNHFHFLVYTTEKSCIERPSFGGKPMQELPYRIGMLLSSYSQAINKQNGTTGSLFQQKTKAKSITDTGRDALSGLNGIGRNYLITCMHYIHQNPYKAELVNKIEDWRFSSFHEYIGGKPDLPCDKGLLLTLTGYDMESFYEDSYAAIEEDAVKMLLE
jgi:putative transposase